jgi:hypothetical protein
MRTDLTKAMIRELQAIERTGDPSDPYDWHNAGAIWFYARDKVIGALLRRGLIADNASGFCITDAGKEALR